MGLARPISKKMQIAEYSATLLLKGHGNEADFLGFLQKLSFLIDPLHYLLSCSAFGFGIAEIFVIEKRLSGSGSRGVGF